jgi:large subunit ribosomal protein L4
MPEIDVYDMNKNVVEKINLNDEIFGAKVVPHLMHETVVAYLANRRSGNAHTKTRKEVSGGGRKPFKQKGTGRARQGTSRAPQMKGGGTVFGPRTRSYNKKVNKKVKRQAFYSALSQKLNEGKLVVIKELLFPNIKTKNATLFLNNFGFSKALIVDNKNANLYKSVRNIPFMKYVNTENLFVYDILKYDSLVLSKEAIQKIQTK